MSNKLSLMVNFIGIDKMSGALRNIMGLGRNGSQSIRALSGEAKKLDRELAKVRRELAAGAGNVTELVNRERQLEQSLAGANRQLERQKRLAAIKVRSSEVAAPATRVGTTASAATGVGITGIAMATRAMAEEAKVMQALATNGSASMEEFQRNAYAVKSVGLDFEKYGDILKDTQDKIGEFAATGGGEMKDFFEKIGPKVGVTVDSFKNLSGPQALQLYYDSLQKAGLSQKEMVFYMEAIADESSRLGPLLQNDGQKMKEEGQNATILGPKDLESLKRYTDASAKMDQQMKDLKISFANSGILEASTEIVKGIGEMADSFAKLPSSVKTGILGLGAVTAAMGPVGFGIAGIAKLWPKVANLDPVEGAKPSRAARAKTVVSKAGSKIGAGARAVAGGAKTAAVAGADKIAAGAKAAIPIMGQFGRVALIMGKNFMRAGIMMLMNPMVLVITALVVAIGVAAYLIYKHWDKITAAFTNGWNWIKQTLSGAGQWLSAMGRAMMDGLLLAINPMALADKLIAVATNGVAAFKSFLGIKSPSRVMMAMGGHVSDGLAIGIDKNSAGPMQAMGRMSAGVAKAGEVSLTPIQPVGGRGAGPGTGGAVIPGSTGASAAMAPAASGPITIIVHGAQGQDVRELAKQVKRELDNLDGVKRRSSYSEAA